MGLLIFSDEDDKLGNGAVLAIQRGLGVGYMCRAPPGASLDDVVQQLYDTRASCVILVGGPAASGLRCVPVYRLPHADPPFAEALLTLLEQRGACAA